MKSVDYQKYDKNYFKEVLDLIDYSKPVTVRDLKEIHRYLTSFIHHKKEDIIVDYGCGSGDLAFLLGMKYQCNILGIDYSPDAIKIANKNKRSLMKTGSLTDKRINFLCASNSDLPKLTNVTAIYLADVIEHLYDEEIDFVMKKFQSWKGRGPLHIIIHTDNNNFLRYLRPFIDLFALITGKSTLEIIKIRNQWEKERHVNLTTPAALCKKFKRYHFKKSAFSYSNVNIKNVKGHLGPLGKLPFIVGLTMFMSKFLPFLLPSFYIVFTKK